MKYSIVFAALAVSLALSGCEKKETVIQPTPAPSPSPAPAPAVVPVPVPVPGPSGAPGSPGAEGPKGDAGRPGSDTVVVVPPAQDADKK